MSQYDHEHRQMEEPPNQQEQQLTLMLTQDEMAAVGATVIYYRRWLARGAKNASTILHLDVVYERIMRHPQVFVPTKVMLRDMHLVIAGPQD